MNRTRMTALAVAALILSAGITYFTYTMLRNRLNPPSELGQIVVISQNAEIGTRLTINDVHLASWPRSVPLEGSFQDPTQAVGRGVIVPMLANEPILESKLAPRDGGAGFTSAIPQGMRAVSVKVNDVIGVAGFVLPGTRVDVIFSGAPTQQSTGDVSKVILENVQVLAAGKNVDRDDTGKPVDVQVITLLVTPEDAQKLALASTDGRMQLALRNPLDTKRTNPQPIERQRLLGGLITEAPLPAKGTSETPPAPRRVAPVPVPVAAPVAAVAPVPPPLIVQVIQGNEIKTVTFAKKP